MNGDGDSLDGAVETTGYGGLDPFISVFDSSGVWQWAKRLGGTDVDEGYGITTDSNNNVIATGWVTGAADLNGDGDSLDGAVETTGYGGKDVYISVFDSSGIWQWAKRLGGAVDDNAHGVTTDTNNNVIVSGRVNSAVADMNGDGDSWDGGAEDATGTGFISVFNSSGTWQWAKRLGERNNGVTTDTNNNIIVTGFVNAAADVNGDGDSLDGAVETTGYGGTDAFISVFQAGASMANCSEGNRCADIVYGGAILADSTQYFWRVRYYDDEGNEGNWSAGGGANHFTTGDGTPPTPNPMTYATAPDDASPTSIVMTVTTGSDPSTPIQYYSQCRTCAADAGTGCVNGSYDPSPTWTSTGLQVNQCYGYRPWAQDSQGNTTVPAVSFYAYTAAAVPGTPTLGSPTLTTLALTNAENGNPAANPTTLFAVQVVTTTPSDATWLNKWVDTFGDPSVTEVWLDDAALDALILQDLNSSTTYGVEVKAINGDSDETAPSAEGQGSTSTPAPTAPTVLFTHATDASSGDTNPIIPGTVTNPHFSAIYNDPNAGDIANAYTIQVDDNSDFSSPVWDSGQTAMANCSEGNRCADIVYAGAALAVGTQYYWRVRYYDDEANEGAWSAVGGANYFNSTDVQQVHYRWRKDNGGEFGSGGWYDLDWGYRKKITIDNAQVDADLTDFPVYVDLADLGADFFSNVKSDGGDIRVSAADGVTELPRQVVAINTGGQTGELHFKASSLSSTQNTYFYIYYGNAGASEPAAASTYGSQNVWINGYAAVLHLDESPANGVAGHDDSTGNPNNGTPQNFSGGAGSTTNATGKISGSDNFDGDNDYVEISDSDPLSIVGDISISAWVKVTDYNTFRGIVGKTSSNSPAPYDYYLSASNGLPDFYRGNGLVNKNVVASAAPSTGVWQHVTVTMSGTEVNHYLNGLPNGNGTLSTTITDANKTLRIGSRDDITTKMKGNIDEVRISNVPRTAQWVKTEFNNQDNPSVGGFLASIGSQETSDWYNASWGFRKKITIDNAQVDADLTDFPVYVNLADLGADFFANVESANGGNPDDGGDIRVTAGEGTTELPRQVVSINVGTQAGELHFKAEFTTATTPPQNRLQPQHTAVRMCGPMGMWGCGIWMNRP